MATRSDIGLYLSVCICIIANAMLRIEGRSTVKLRHGHIHHSRQGYRRESTSYNPELFEDRNDDSYNEYRDFRNPASRDPKIADRFESSEYEDVREEKRMLFARFKRKNRSKHRESPRPADEERRTYENDKAAPSTEIKIKHHRKRFATAISQNMTAEQRKAMYQHVGEDMEYEQEQSAPHLATAIELEVMEAQNRSLCKYTVKSITEFRGTGPIKNLVHVMCNQAGSSCHNAGKHCCLQTFKEMEVEFDDGRIEYKKIYMGCVCALRLETYQLRETIRAETLD